MEPARQAHGASPVSTSGAAGKPSNAAAEARTKAAADAVEEREDTEANVRAEAAGAEAPLAARKPTRYATRLAAALGSRASPETLLLAKDVSDLVESATAASADAPLMDAAMAALGAAGAALESAAPALLIAAPVALAIGALLRQVSAMRENRELLAELTETASALMPVLAEVSRNDAVAKEHAAAILGLAAALNAAAALAIRMGSRGRVMSLLAAGHDGAKLRALTERVAAWVPVLTAAVTAGAEGRLAERMAELRQQVACDMQAALQEQQAALVDILTRASAGSQPPSLLVPPPVPSAAEVDAWRDDLAGELARLRVPGADASALAQVAAAAAELRHAQLVAGLREALATVDGGNAAFAAAMTRAEDEASVRDAALAESVRAVRSLLDGVGSEVGEVKAMLGRLAPQLAAEYAASRSGGSTAAAAADASRRAASSAASRLLLAQVPSVPHGRLVLWEDEELGRGSFGVVHAGALLPGAARSAHSSVTPVAVKRLQAAPASAAFDPAAVARFVHEVRLQAAMGDHLPVAVVGVHGLYEAPAGSGALLVCELMTTSLDEALHGGPGVGLDVLRLPDALALLRDVSLALAALHGGARGAVVTHADVKAGNVLLGRDGRPRLADFGMAAARSMSGTTLLSSQAGDATVLRARGGGGTPAYMAPELWALDAAAGRFTRATPATDVYAFGVLAAEVLTRQRPFANRADIGCSEYRLATAVVAGARPSMAQELLPLGTPPCVVDLVASCWAGDASARPSMEGVARALGDALDELTGNRRLACHLTLPSAAIERLARLDARASALTEAGSALELAGSGPPKLPFSVTGGAPFVAASSSRDDPVSMPASQRLLVDYRISPADVIEGLDLFESADGNSDGAIEYGELAALALLRPCLAPLGSAVTRAVLLSLVDVVTHDEKLDAVEFLLLVAASRALANAGVAGRASQLTPPSAADVAALTAQVAAATLAATVAVGDEHGGDTALHTAARGGDVQELVRLLGCNAVFRHVRNWQRETALHAAAAAGRAGAVGVLLESGLRVDAVDARGRTPLDAALAVAGGGASPTVELLRSSTTAPLTAVNCAVAARSSSESYMADAKAAEAQWVARWYGVPPLAGVVAAKLKRRTRWGGLVVESDGHAGGVVSLAALPDGRLASGGLDHTVRLWRVAREEGCCVVTLRGHTGPVWSLAVLSDGRLASGSDDKSIRVWDVCSDGGGVDGALTLTGHTDAVFRLAALSDNRLASGSLDGTVRVWSITAARDCVLSSTLSHGCPVNAVAALPVGRLASLGENLSVRIWEPALERGGASWSCVFDNEQSTPGSCSLAAALSPDARFLFASDNNVIRVLALESDGRIARLSQLVGHNDFVTSIVTLPDGRLASASTDGTVRLWEVTQHGAGSCVATLTRHKCSVIALAVLSDGRLASCDKVTHGSREPLFIAVAKDLRNANGSIRIWR